jgi:hypothetical protein
MVALIVSAAMALAPLDTELPHSKIVFLHGIGIVLGVAYSVALIFLVYAVITKKWEPYIEASIAKAEARFAHLRGANRTDPSTNSG